MSRILEAQAHLLDPDEAPIRVSLREYEHILEDSRSVQLDQIDDVTGACLMRVRFASRSTARFRLRMLEVRTNELPVGTSKARSCSPSRK